MTKQQELEFYKNALIDWSKPISESLETNTRFGFCCYFSWRDFPTEIKKSLDDHLLSYLALSEILSTLYSLRINKGFEGYYWFNGTGRTEKGRKQRVDALKKAIEILENELKSESHG